MLSIAINIKNLLLANPPDLPSNETEAGAVLTAATGCSGTTGTTFGVS